MSSAPTTVAPFPFPVRLFHRETLASYTKRLLAANFSDQSHLNALTAAAQKASDLTAPQARAHVVAAAMGRPNLHDPKHSAGWMIERDRTLEGRLHTRYACTLCTGGEEIQLDPHFDDIICQRHHRWLGLWGGPAEQHPVSAEVVHAQRTFTKLLREDRITVRLYRITARALAIALHPDLATEDAEARVFATTINLIAAITRPEYARRLFDTGIPFADNYRTLHATVQAITSAVDPVTRALWISLHPTVKYIRDFRTDNKRWLSDIDRFPLSQEAMHTLLAARGELEPMENYFTPTGDTPATAARLFNELNRLRSPNSVTIPSRFTCTKGHTFEYLPPMYDLTTPRHLLTPTCLICTTRQPRSGDEFATVRPDLVDTFDRYRNGGLTASDITSTVQIPYWWTCASGHSHRASPNDKVIGEAGCTIHNNRITVLGINSLIDTHPELAAQCTETWDGPRSPARNSAGSRTLARWKCAEGHIFPARYSELTSGKVSCHQCKKKKKKRKRQVRYEDSLAARYPEQAKLWHPTRNGPLTPADVTPGVRTVVWWLCSEGHDNQGRVDKRAQGQVCGTCTGRKLNPGVNDLATREPVLSLEYHQDKNPLRANEIFASNHKLHWECFANGHVHTQTTQHRRESRGCPLCPAEERILNQLTAV